MKRVSFYQGNCHCIVSLW